MIALAIFGCGDGDPGTANDSGVAIDAPPADAGTQDTGVKDATTGDASSSVDSGNEGLDAGTPDAGPTVEGATTCEAAPLITTSTKAGIEVYERGGSPPTGTGCGTIPEGFAYYYSVSIPANTQFLVTTETFYSHFLLTQDTCGGDCTSRTDEDGSIVITNDSDAPITKIVVVYREFMTGGYNIWFFYSPIPESITASCIDTGAATALAVTTDDSSSDIAAMPFSFEFYGETVSHYSATSNGFAQLWTSESGSPSTSPRNDPIPSFDTPHGYVAPFWDDLYPNAGADVYALTTGTSGSQIFTVEWRNWRTRFSERNADDLTFQAQLHEATGQIEFHYCAMVAGSSSLHGGDAATIGAESLEGTAGTLVSYNTADAVATGDGFRLTP